MLSEVIVVLGVSEVAVHVKEVVDVVCDLGGDEVLAGVLLRERGKNTGGEVSFVGVFGVYRGLEETALAGFAV
jgi:hypothetical protein